MTLEEAKKHHAAQAEIAAALYTKSLTSDTFAAAWHLALRESRTRIVEALRKSKMLSEVGAALEESGAHMRTFRFLMAPPISQDQFKLLCPRWNKSGENKGRPMRHEIANEIAAIFHTWRQRHLTAWIDQNKKPTKKQMRLVLTSIAPLLAQQAFGTALRNQRSSEQESAVIKLLGSLGWTRLPSRMVDTRASIGAKQFMYKTRFSTGDGGAQEVDIACGLKDTFVLAMECKVTNDQTNSVKRINDVMKKATAWKDHWGNFVETAALLQGVIAPKDVNRLLHAGVHVFWSHDLKTFEAWVIART